jgi:hypothetical protein
METLLQFAGHGAEHAAESFASRGMEKVLDDEKAEAAE